MPRIEFVTEHEDRLDDTLRPIYRSPVVMVRQDASYALPGFYVVSPTSHFRALDELDELSHLRLQLVIRHVRAAMRKVLGVREIHLHYEEKPDLSTNVHYWLVPMRYDVAVPGDVLARLDIKTYLSQFRFAEERANILSANERMRDWLAGGPLLRLEQELAELASRLGPRAGPRS